MHTTRLLSISQPVSRQGSVQWDSVLLAKVQFHLVRDWLWDLGKLLTL